MAISPDTPKVPEEPKGITEPSAKTEPKEVVERTSKAAEKGGISAGAGTTKVHEPQRPITPVPSPPPSSPPSSLDSPKVSRKTSPPQETYTTPGFKGKIDAALQQAGATRASATDAVKKKILEELHGYTKIEEIVNHEKFAGNLNFEMVKGMLSDQQPNTGIIFYYGEDENLYLAFKDNENKTQWEPFTKNDSVEGICKELEVALMEISPAITEDPHFKNFSCLNLFRLAAIKVDVSREQQPKDYTSEFTVLGLVQKEELSMQGVMPTQNGRNRDLYTNVQPYVHNMAPCAETEDNQERYLNASFVVAEGKLFLACQGPLKNPNTIPDLWSATISNNSKLILSLGLDIDGTKFKFSNEFFLDDKKKITVGTSEGQCTVVQKEQKLKEKIEITTSTGSFPAKFIIREYEITLPNGTVKTIKNCHCPTWPDGGAVPPEVLERLIGYINRECKESEDAVTVHCSAGIGRTGTLIGAYSIDKKIQAGAETIALGAIVTATRAQRFGSVQVKEQLSLLAQYAQHAKKKVKEKSI